MNWTIKKNLFGWISRNEYSLCRLKNKCNTPNFFLVLYILKPMILKLFPFKRNRFLIKMQWNVILNLQFGHSRFFLSHLLRHTLWKTCPQGKALPKSINSIQMVQTASSSWNNTIQCYTQFFFIRINIFQASLKVIRNFKNSQPVKIPRWFLTLI